MDLWIQVEIYLEIMLIIHLVLTLVLKQASDNPIPIINAEEIDKKIQDHIDGDLLYLDGATFLSSTILNKLLSQS